MILTEQKKKSEQLNKLIQLFAEKFESIEINGKTCFKKQNGNFFSVFSFPGEFALAIEYAENLEEAKENRFEDGDLFYLEEKDEESIYQKMLQEIQQ